MRVLFVSGEFPPMQGGVGDYTCELGLALAGLGCQVHVATSVRAGPVEGLAVHPLLEKWNWNSWRLLLDLIGRHRPDVVHVQYQAAAYAMHPAINLWPRRLRRLGNDRPRSAVTFHDLKVPYLFPKAGRLRRWVVNELARSSDVAITTNQQDFLALSQAMDRLPALIPIGSNITPSLPAGFDRDAWRARWGAGPDDLILSFFGFINDRKGVDVLLQALDHEAASRRPMLLFIGGQTGDSDPTNVSFLARIRELIADLDLEDRVHWTGYVPAEEVSASFMAADLCVLPFRDGVSFLHGTFHAALAHGVPIITTRPQLDLPELSHGQNVWLVPPGDPEALARAIEALAARPEQRRALGQGARELAAHFRWPQIAADTLQLYREIGAGR
ncbi:MAG: glycosyltransferase family 4 protein [Anaerolineae bacterium]|jgi:glycosyltransferase involved in cell wall biosynthesis